MLQSDAKHTHTKYEPNENGKCEKSKMLRLNVAHREVVHKFHRKIIEKFKISNCRNLYVYSKSDYSHYSRLQFIELKIHFSFYFVREITHARNDAHENT